MANKTEFSRLVTKGSSVSGITPTVNSGDTIDATWIDSDILNREMFINVEDKKVFIRANDDILEFVTQYSGSTPLENYLPLSGGVMDSGAQVFTNTNSKVINFGIPGFSDDLLLIGDAINILIPPSAGTSSGILFYPSGGTNNAFRINNLDATNLLESIIGMDITGVLSGNIDLAINDNPFGAPNFISRLKIDTDNISLFNTDAVSISANNGIYAAGSSFSNSGVATLSSNEYINNTEAQLALTADSGSTFGRFIVSNGLDQVNLDLSLNALSSTISAYEDATGNQTQIYVNPSLVVINSNFSSIVLEDSIQRMRINSSYFSVNNDAFFQKSNSFTSVTTTNFGKNGVSICSQNSTINQGVNNSVILGGSLITATTSNTVYVPDLVIKKSAAVPTSSGDTVGNIGSVTWDDNYFYTKTNTGWGRVALDYGF